MIIQYWQIAIATIITYALGAINGMWLCRSACKRVLDESVDELLKEMENHHDST